jgi:hypothetical protein
VERVKKHDPKYNIGRPHNVTGTILYKLAMIHGQSQAKRGVSTTAANNATMGWQRYRRKTSGKVRGKFPKKSPRQKRYRKPRKEPRKARKTRKEYARYVYAISCLSCFSWFPVFVPTFAIRIFRRGPETW